MALRLRLKFQRGILKKSQRSDGLKRSWILVNPQHETISNVVSHILHAFDLYHTCPNGVLLSMEGFILPLFISANILRDKDLICVKRKGAKLVKITDECREETANLEHNVTEKQTFNPCVQLFLNEELGKEIGCYECENEEDEDKKETDVLHEENVPNEDVPVKKRKASKELKSSKRKRQRQVLHKNDEQEAEKEHHGARSLNRDISKKLSKSKQARIPEVAGEIADDAKHKAHSVRKRQRQVLHEIDEQEAQKEHHGASLLNGDLSKKLLKIKQAHIPDVAMENPDNVMDNAHTVSLDESGEGTKSPSGLSNKTVQSRSARRKKNKRLWLRAEKEQLFKNQSLEEDRNADLRPNEDQNLDTDIHPLQLDEPKEQNPDAVKYHLQPDEDSDTEDEIVPIVVRPGHIRFAAPGKEKDIEHNDEAKESFNWSGTINKKKGQKWGRENHSASKWNENRAPCENQSSTKKDECRSPKEQHSHSTQHDSTIPRTNCVTREVPPDNASLVNALLVDFEKLVPMVDSPVEGDIIAYRLVELSSSFCPELTEYRVGKVSWFDTESKRVMLVPVPQYPFEFTKTPDDDTSEELSETSCYNEDGSLEIEFQSFVDVRIVKRGEVIPVPAIHHKANGVPSSGSGLNTEALEGNNPSTQEQSIRNNATGVNNSASSAAEPGCNPGPENGTKDAWEDISATLSAKKAELQKEDNWNKKRFWSYRASRSCALGPTLAILRAQNNHKTE